MRDCEVCGKKIYLAREPAERHGVQPGAVGCLECVACDIGVTACVACAYKTVVSGKYGPTRHKVCPKFKWVIPPRAERDWTYGIR